MHIKIEESTIYPSASVRFLGVVLDSCLNWNAHVEHIVKKCEIPVRILCCIRGTWWGTDPSIMITLYKSLIRSRIEYGGFLMSPCKLDLFHKVEKIQLKCLRLAMGYRNSIPVNIIYSETKILPLEYRFKLTSCKYLIGSMAKQHNQLNEVLEEISELSENFVHENNFTKSTLVSTYEIVKPYEKFIFKYYIPFYQLEYKNQFNQSKVDLNSGMLIKDDNNADYAFWQVFGDKLNNRTAIFTDGSKINTDEKSSVGFASWCSNDDFITSFKLFDVSSIFSAEAVAILSALNQIIKSDLTRFTIFSDSKSVLTALMNIRKLKHHPHLIQEINQELVNCKLKDKDVELTWISAHRNIQGNEKADSLAKKAAVEGPMRDIAVLHSDVYSIFKSMCIKNNEEFLYHRAFVLNKGIFFFENYHCQSSKTWFSDLNFSRRDIITLNRLHSGHNSLKDSLFRFKITESNLCSCGLIENANYLLWECNKFHKERKNMEDKFRKLKINTPIDIREILKKMKNSELKIIVEFFNKCKIDV
ncbi:hypothetical protein ALC57_06435 [Trachymyrmex cornetzi]|uniref:RNase H type-1 domain-containing protein n=1 Tax=Trachymyrmex cornetzi TaxID=471704 RepID=A0A151J8K8_9HYME|nr:hypothetical protein ALC57_06435 [Trachymyrmex cornetzi]